MLDYSPALMTDMYEYTMLDACLRDGTANRKCVFEIFTRHLPLGRHYGVVAGQGRILDALENFHLDDNDLKFLADRKVVGPDTIKWLENFHFSGSIKGYREGEMFFPNSPILQVEGTFGECTLLETLLLSILNYDSAVASAASRMVSAAKDRPCMDMGGRSAMGGARSNGGGRRCRCPCCGSGRIQGHGQSAGRANVWLECHRHSRALLHAGA